MTASLDGRPHEPTSLPFCLPKGCPSTLAGPRQRQARRRRRRQAPFEARAAAPRWPCALFLSALSHPFPPVRHRPSPSLALSSPLPSLQLYTHSPTRDPTLLPLRPSCPQPAGPLRQPSPSELAPGRTPLPRPPLTPPHPRPSSMPSNHAARRGPQRQHAHAARGFILTDEFWTTGASARLGLGPPGGELAGEA